MNKSSFLADMKFMLALAFALSAIMSISAYLARKSGSLTTKTLEAALTLTGQSLSPLNEENKKAFEQTFAQIQGGKTPVWRFLNMENVLLLEASGNGMWGLIRLVMLFDTVENRILGVQVVEQNETSGLGGFIAEKPFLSKFTGMMAQNTVELAAMPIEEHQFDAISGATVSCKAVERIINEALRTVRSL